MGVGVGVGVRFLLAPLVPGKEPARVRARLGSKGNNPTQGQTIQSTRVETGNFWEKGGGVRAHPVSQRGTVLVGGGACFPCRFREGSLRDSRDAKTRPIIVLVFKPRILTSHPTERCPILGVSPQSDVEVREKPAPNWLPVREFPKRFDSQHPDLSERRFLSLANPPAS